MNKLEEQFSYNGFNFQMLKRKGMVALFEKTKPGLDKPGYEVVIIQTMDERTWPAGNTTPAHEFMPGKEQWGRQAWTPHDLFQAEKWFRDVVKNGHPSKTV